MDTVAYKCPNCASPLTFDGASGKMICRACDSRFEPDAVEAMYAAQTGGGIDFDTPDEGYAASDVAQMKAYRCNSCGAELITEGTTTATECPYCGSPTILPDRIDGGIRPELVVPFVISKEEAQQSELEELVELMSLIALLSKEVRTKQILRTGISSASGICIAILLRVA